MKAGLFGDIFGGGKTPSASWSSTALEELGQKGSLLPPSWSELDGLLRSSETKFERDEYDLIAAGTGRGPSSHKANLRLFDAPDGFEPEVTLYRDTAGWCPYCQKVWLQLEGEVTERNGSNIYVCLFSAQIDILTGLTEVLILLNN
jgi:hypothetical protein